MLVPCAPPRAMSVSVASRMRSRWLGHRRRTYQTFVWESIACSCSLCSVRVKGNGARRSCGERPGSGPESGPETGNDASSSPRYDPGRYPPVAVTVDVVLLTVRSGRLSVLLVERRHHPFRGSWALPGGFVEPDDDLDGAARRELEEETGVLVSGFGESVALGHLEQLRSYGTPGRDPRMRVISVAYVGLHHAERAGRGAGSDAADVRLWAIDDLAIPGRRQRPTAFPSPSTTRRSSPTASNARAPSSNTRRSPPRSSTNRSRSASCAASTKRCGARRSTKATSGARCCRRPDSSNRPAAPRRPTAGPRALYRRGEGDAPAPADPAPVNTTCSRRLSRFVRSADDRAPRDRGSGRASRAPRPHRPRALERRARQGERRALERRRARRRDPARRARRGPWLGVTITDAQLIADIAAGYDVGGDGRRQVGPGARSGLVRRRSPRPATRPSPRSPRAGRAPARLRRRGCRSARHRRPSTRTCRRRVPGPANTISSRPTRAAGCSSTGTT